MRFRTDSPRFFGAERTAPKWDDYWVKIAEAVSQRSGDPHCQVGAVIVNENVLLSTGYNGFARGVQHHEYRLEKEYNEKLRWMCHAEQNAIYNAARAGVSVEGARIYTTKFPCLLCTNAIVQAGITSIYTIDQTTYKDTIMGDEGERVFHVLSETNVSIEAPNLKRTLTMNAAKKGRYHGSRTNGKP